ncbi:MAG: enoyl-CoA hydratase/isomerase family protein [Gammaproteobacteria bacterium]|nr:enoyl-CoA hydratase/isomerase family protein [Gammaproteobacteria bacterium]
MLDQTYTCIKLERDAQSPWVLHLTLDRPQSRNAMSLAMVNELSHVLAELESDFSVRAIILRGEGGHFCAGGDIKDMANARAQVAQSAKQENGSDPYFELNKQFGELILKMNQIPQVVVCVLEGAILGGGFGLACVSDVAIATSTAKFGLPETSLGIPPAQIAPFVVKRIGLTQTRRLALLGERFDGEESVRLGISHFYAKDDAELDQLLGRTLDQVKNCAPKANAVTKKLILKAAEFEASELIEEAAQAFSAAVQGQEGVAGTMAFVQKKPAPWAIS